MLTGPASSANSSAATYTVAHASGSATVTVNQKQNGGQWRLLGTYGFTPGAGHRVSLAAAADGRVVADAIRLVAASGPPADIVYIHPDQLGGPQKMTDAARAVVWDRQAGPFGELETIAGLAQMPLRFPGQYADAETGFSYNYYRDYDPALGRYIESDPIGLSGGLNTYAYVGGNPVNRSDPYGLWFGVDDAGAALGGAIFGLAAQGLGDYVGGNNLCWQNYVGAAAGGAAGGVATLYGGILVGGAVGGGATGLLQLGLNNLTGSCGCESLDPMWGAIGGGAGGYIGGKFLAPVLGRLGPLARQLLADETGSLPIPRFLLPKPSTLRPGPYAKESIPGHRGPPTVEEQAKINELMQKNGCHTCGTKTPGTKSGNAVADHQPPQTLGEPKIFLPHCIGCMRLQGGQVYQEILRRLK